MTQPKDYFVGFTSKSAPDALFYMEEPAAPSNYKKPEAIKDYQDREREKFVERAHLTAVTGTVTAVHFEDVRGETLFSVADPTPGTVSCLFAKFLLDSGFEYSWGLNDSAPDHAVWGFDVDQLFRMVGLEVMRYGKDCGLGDYPPLRMWYQNNKARDPMDVVFGAGERRVVSLAGLFHYLSLPLDPRSLDRGYNRDAHVEASSAARRLAVRTGLAYYKPLEAGAACHRPGAGW